MAGWGETRAGSEIFSTSLQSAGVNVLSRPYCKEHAEADNQIQGMKVDEFCAGTPDSDGDGFTDAGKDTCLGNGGEITF